MSQKVANELGIYDMSGDVWEWCWDWWSLTYPSEGTTDPKGPSTSQTNRSVRGGAFVFNETYSPVVYRNWVAPTSPNYYLGFRCVQD